MMGAEQAALDTYKAHAAEYLDTNAAVFDFVVQVATSRQHDINSANCEWDERFSPYVAVGTFTLPAQSLRADTEMNRSPDTLAFNPWATLKAHRPLGPMQRARREVYKAHQAGRWEVTGAEASQCPYLMQLREKQ